MRQCAAVARLRARAMLAARGLEIADVARLAKRHDPNQNRSSDCRLNIICACLRPAAWYKPPPRSIGWTLVARALRVTLRDLCDDPTWVAEQEAHAAKPTQPRRHYRARLSALRPSARTARRTLRTIMADRCLCRADLARAMSEITTTSSGGPYDILNSDPSVISRYWPLAARVLGITLADLCADPAWIAAQPLDA